MVAPDILSPFAVVLLDMNGTFMFREDRFGPDQDYAATYRALGGRRLAAELVQAIMAACHETDPRRRARAVRLELLGGPGGDARGVVPT